MSSGRIYHFSVRERVILFIAPYLGAKIFKRYWPGSGSYWKAVHIRSDSVGDLESLVSESRDNLALHVRGIFYTGIVTVSLIALPRYFMEISDSTRSNINISVMLMLIQIMMSSYAIMIQQYNIILARSRIARLGHSSTVESPREDDQPIKIYHETYDGGKWYYLYGFGKRLSRSFDRTSTAEEFREYLYKHLSRDPGFLSSRIVDDDHKSVYLNWLKEQ
jgi:hypothetical protein